MSRHFPERDRPASPDRFTERCVAVSVLWNEGREERTVGWRSGTGAREPGPGGLLRFHVTDGPQEGAAHGSETPEIGETEIAGAIAYVEEAVRAAAGESEHARVSGRVHLYRQFVQHERGGVRTSDQRSGARVELVAQLPRGQSVTRRAAASSGSALRAAMQPARLGQELGRAIVRAGAPARRTSGAWPVIFARGTCGALVHEIGHMFEEEHPVMRGPGHFRRGETVAPAYVTLLDDPRLTTGRGAYRLDDEGREPGECVLLREGVVEGFLDAPPASGHVRRASYRGLPSARMACTVMPQGHASSGDLLGEVTEGLLVHAACSGRVDPFSGVITLLVTEGSWIERGRIGAPIAPCYLTATAREVLASVAGIGGDVELDGGAGDCLKGEQPIPVATGQPTVLLRSIEIVSP